MKTSLKLLTGALTIVVSVALAASPSYVTKNASGSTSATVVFPAQSGKQIRIVGAIATSDKVASVFSFRTGGAAYAVTNNASASAIVYQLKDATGLTTNDVVMLQTSTGTTASTTINYVTNSVYLVVAATFGTAVTTNDSIYELSSATTIKCGNTTATYQGEAIYVGAQNRPVRLVLDGTSACSLDSITARYE